MLGESHISVKSNVTNVPVIGQMNPSDWYQVRAIYLEGIATGNATFETEAPSWEAWDSSHLPIARLVARWSDRVAGWAALSPVSQRCVYGGVAEVSVYVSQTHRHSGLGRQLLSALISESEKNGIWTLQAGMFPENVGSLILHRRSCFRDVVRSALLSKYYMV